MMTALAPIFTSSSTMIWAGAAADWRTASVVWCQIRTRAPITTLSCTIKPNAWCSRVMSGATDALIGRELWYSSALTPLTSRAKRRCPRLRRAIDSNQSPSGLVRRLAAAHRDKAIIGVRGRASRGQALGSAAMQAVSDLYTIPQEHLDFCATIGQIARE